MGDLTLRLDEYEAANLLLLLDHLWNGHSELPINNFYTGDWVGQVPRKLATAMIGAGRIFLDCQPNGVLPLENDGKMLITRQMVARCAGECPHCGSRLLLTPP